MKDFKQCWEAEVSSVTLLSLCSVSVCTNLTPKVLSSNLFPSPMARLANPNQDLIVIFLSSRPNTSQPYSPSPPQSLSPPAHLCSFLTLFPDSAEPNTALGDAEHTALQTVAVSSGSNMLEVSIVAELSQPQQAASTFTAELLSSLLALICSSQESGGKAEGSQHSSHIVWLASVKTKRSYYWCTFILCKII